MSNFSEWLKEKRVEADITQAELGEMIGVTQAAICSWENGTSKPRKKSAQAIEKIFGKYREEPTSENFGKWLTQTREQMGLSQAELAKKSGVSNMTIYFIETGKTTSPRPKTVELLTRVLGTPTEETAERMQEEREVEGIGEFLGPFAIEEWQENVESVPAVYVLYDSINRPVRIGQTKDMKRRLREYADNYWWFRHPTVVSFAYVTVNDESTRKVIEKTIIKFMGAHVVFNRQDTL